MSTLSAMMDKLQDEVARNWSRTEAAMRYSLKPQAPQVGLTPKDVVWTKNKAKLYRYHAQTEQRHATPILLVYALINRPYIMDLAPGSSLVEYLVQQGYDVFMLDWGVPGEEDADITLSDYVFGYIAKAAEQVLRHSGASAFSLIGYCQGGTLSAMYAAAHPEAPLKNLVLLTTPVDFSEAGLFSAWLDPRHFDVDRVVDAFPLVPPSWFELGSKLLKPLPNYVGPFVTLWDRLDDEAFIEGWLPMNHWVNDGIPFPGAAYRQWIKEFYQQNRLIKDEVSLGGRPIRLGNITCSLLNVYGELDHIVQTCQALALMDKVASTDKDTLAVRAGHVGVVAGRSARKNFYPKLDAWLAERS